MSIDENGYLFDGRTTLFLFQRVGEDYVPLTTTSYVDGTAVQAAVDALLAQSDPAQSFSAGPSWRRLTPPWPPSSPPPPSKAIHGWTPMG